MKTLDTGHSVDRKVDILIAGGGLVGLTCALALHHELAGDVKILICDPAPPVQSSTVRAYAVASAGRHFLNTIGLWPKIAADAQPVHDMVISDSRLHDPVRQPILTFTRETEGAPLAHLVDESQLVALTRQAADAAGVAFIQDAVSAVETAQGAVTITLASGTTVKAALLVAADGGNSRCRQLTGIGVVGWDYDQTGLVALIGHERDHEGKAYQHFLPPGPFAILPMTGNRSSIVWNERRDDAASILAMDEDDQKRELERRFGAFLGRLTFLTPLRGYPLRFQLSRQFAGERIALVGDAAHIVHPIAGQGLNLGLLDAQALAMRVAASARIGLDLADPSGLQAFERDRRADTVAKGFSMDALNRLFSNDLTPVRMLRDLGLGLVERMPVAKQFFMRNAAGKERPEKPAGGPA